MRETEGLRYAVFALNEYHAHADDDPIYYGDDINDALRAMARAEATA